MLKNIYAALGVLCLICLLASDFACITVKFKPTGASTPSFQDWNYKQAITSPLSGQIGSQQLSLGDLNTNNVKVDFPNNSASKTAAVILQTPTSVPKIDVNAITPIGSPIDISAGGAMRLDAPAILSWKLTDKNKYAADLKRNDIWVTYYNGSAWEYLRPDSYDINQGLVKFTTYHLCIFGLGKIDQQEKIEKFIHSESLAEVTQQEILDSAVNNLVKNALEDLLLDKYGMDEESVRYKIMSSLANDDDYRDIAENLKNGKLLEVNTQMQIFIGKKIAENVEESVLKSMMENLTSDTGLDLTAAAAQAAGHFAEGQYKEGTRIAGEAIANSFLITNLAKGAIENVQYHISQWKDQEIEAAFQVFKNGRESWGYSVDAGKFDDLWNQMKGIATKIEADAVQAEIERRNSLSLPPATAAQLDAIRARAKADMRKQFEDRAKKETAIEKEEAKLKDLIKVYISDGLIKDGDYGFINEMDVEYRLAALKKIRNMIIADSGRKGWSMSPFSNEQTVGVADIIALTKAWYSGEAEYKKQLAKRFPDAVKTKDEITCSLTINPAKVDGTAGTQYTFTATANNVPANVRYDWTINGKNVQSGPNNSIAPTFNKAGQFQIMVVMYENTANKDLCDALASASIKAAEQKTTTAQPTTPVAVTPAPTMTTTAPTTTSGGGWLLDGSPVITKNQFPTVSCGYFGFNYNISSGSATGSQSWKDCSNQSKCSGTLTGTDTWTPPPSFMTPGTKISFTGTSNTAANSTCASPSISSWMSMKINGGMILDVLDRRNASQTNTYTVPTGSPGQKMNVAVTAQAVGLVGYVTYNYTYVSSVPPLVR